MDGPIACASILKLIQRPGHGDMLCAWVYYEAKRSLNQKKCLSLVLFSLKTAFWWFLFLFSRVLRAFSDRQTDRPTDRRTKWLIESRARNSISHYVGQSVCLLVGRSVCCCRLGARDLWRLALFLLKTAFWWFLFFSASNALKINWRFIVFN